MLYVKHLRHDLTVDVRFGLILNSEYVSSQAGLEGVILLPQFPECWGYSF